VGVTDSWTTQALLPEVIHRSMSDTELKAHSDIL
jgi:hypothetical protein